MLARIRDDKHSTGIWYIFALKVLVVISDLEMSSKQGRELTYIKVPRIY